MPKKSLFLLTLVGMGVILIIGIVIPKLTVRDTVVVDQVFRQNVMQAVNAHYDNPVERVALRLGKSRIVSVTPLSAEVESFTLFRLPLGFFRGIPNMKLGIFFNPARNWSVKVISDAIDFEPDEQIEDDGLWQILVDQKQGIKFKYPKELIAEYISVVDWPPVVTISSGIRQLTCDETSPESSLPKRIMRRQVDDRVYCVEALSEGAAGSVYTQYSYSTLWEERLVTISVTLQFPQCYNYDEPAQTNCKNERESFDLDGIIDRIVSSLEDN